jgi:hypothetical protein
LFIFKWTPLEFWTPLAWYRPIKWKGWYAGWNTKKQHLFHQHFCILHATKNIKLSKSNWGMLHVVKTFLHFLSSLFSMAKTLTLNSICFGVLCLMLGLEIITKSWTTSTFSQELQLTQTFFHT